MLQTIKAHSASKRASHARTSSKPRNVERTASKTSGKLVFTIKCVPKQYFNARLPRYTQQRQIFPFVSIPARRLHSTQLQEKKNNNTMQGETPTQHERATQRLPSSPTPTLVFIRLNLSACSTSQRNRDAVLPACELSSWHSIAATCL